MATKPNVKGTVFRPRMAQKTAGTVSQPRKTAKEKAAKAALAIAKVNTAARDGQPDPLELHALMIVGKRAGEHRDALEAAAGQAIDVTLRIHGAVNVGAGQTANLALTPSPKNLLAHVLAAVDDPSKLKVIRAVVEAHRDYVLTGNEPECPAAWTAAVAELLDVITHRTTQDRRGNVSGAVAVEVLARGRRHYNAPPADAA